MMVCPHVILVESGSNVGGTGMIRGTEVGTWGY